MPTDNALIAAAAEREASTAPPLRPGTAQWECLRALLQPTPARKTA